jgi:hypothetical protein
VCSSDLTHKFFYPINAERSAAYKALGDDFTALAEEEKAKLDNMRNQPLASDRISQAAAQIQSEAQIRAQGRANELGEITAHNEAKAAVETQALTTWEEIYEKSKSEEQKINERNARYALSGASSMFSNLSKLQESHSKTAQQIGMIAAKGKIVTDTASAAMGAYSALAAIPIVGPGLGAAAAAAAIAAGAIQLGNVDSGSIGTSNTQGPADTSTTNIGGISGPATQSQTLILQGDSFSAESLTKIFADAKERGYTIDGVRRG